MRVYTVTYDIKLGSGTHDYGDLWAALDRLESERILYSVYVVATANWNAADLHDHLLQFLDPADRLWVSRVTDDHRGIVMGAGANWLEQNPPS